VWIILIGINLDQAGNNKKPVTKNQQQINKKSKMSKGITTRAEDYSQWYNDLVLKGGLADYSAVRGCMV